MGSICNNCKRSKVLSIDHISTKTICKNPLESASSIGISKNPASFFKTSTKERSKKIDFFRSCQKAEVSTKKNKNAINISNNLSLGLTAGRIFGYQDIGASSPTKNLKLIPKGRKPKVISRCHLVVSNKQNHNLSFGKKSVSENAKLFNNGYADECEQSQLPDVMKHSKQLSESKSYKIKLSVNVESIPIPHSPNINDRRISLQIPNYHFEESLNNSNKFGKVKSIVVHSRLVENPTNKTRRKNLLMESNSSHDPTNRNSCGNFF